MATDWVGLASQGNTNTKPSKPDQGSITNAIEKTGAYNLPVIGGIARDITQPINSLLETGAEDVRAVGQKLSGQNGPYEPKFVSPNIAKALIDNPKAAANPIGAAGAYELGQLPSQVGALATAQGVGSLPKIITKIPAMIEDIPNKVRLLTPSGAGKAIETAKDAGVKLGQTHTGADILTEARQAIEKKYGKLASGDPALDNAFGQVAQHVTGIKLTPATFSKLKDFKTIGGELNSADLISKRQSVVNRFGYVPNSDNILHNVANEFRDILTRRAKEITPGLAKADEAYVKSQAIKDAMKNLGPTLLRNAGISAAAIGGADLVSKVFSGGSQDQNQP